MPTKHRLCLTVLLACLAPIASLPAQSQLTETPIQLAPAAEQSFPILIPPGQILSLAIEQRIGTLQAHFDPPYSPPPITPDLRTNRAGKLSLILFHALNVSGTLTVKNLTKSPAEFRLILTPPHTPTPTDTLIQQAEHSESVAAAQPKTPAGAAKSLPFLQAAEHSWHSANLPIEQTHALALEIYTQAFPANDGAAALLKLPALLTLAAQIESLSPVESANARKTAAFVCAKQAKYDDALTQYNLALTLYERTADTYNRVVVLENRAKIERIQAHYALALADIDAALPLAHADNDAHGELALEVERGAIASASGQLGIAYESDLRAISLARQSPSPYLEAIAWSDLAVAYTELHDFPGANRALDHADAIWKANPNPYGQLQTQDDRAELRLAQGDLPGARTFFSSGAESAAKSSLPREHAYFLRGLAVTESRSGHLADAQTHLRQAALEAEQAQVNDTLSTIDSSLADLEASQHHWPEAAADWEKAANLAIDSNDTLDQVIALAGLVRVAVHSANFPLANDRCRQAMTALESIRGAIGDSDLRLSFFASRHALYDLCVQTALHSKSPEAQQSAFDAAERGRARSLLDQAAAAGVLAELPNGLPQRIQQNDRQLAAARKQLSSRQKSQAQKDIAALLQSRESLRTEAEDSGLTGRLAADSLPLSQQEIISRLDPYTALLAYWLAPTRSVAWLITAHGASIYTVPASAALQSSTRHYLESLLAPLALNAAASASDRSHAIDSASGSALRQGLALRRSLLPMPIPPHIRRLLVVNEGVLQSISFASLPLDDGAYLGQRFALATEPSAAFAWRPSPPAGPFTQIHSVVFTDPSDTLTKPDNPLHQASLNRTAWTAPLPFARQESQLLQQTFGDRNTRIFAGPAATRANALSLDWTQYGVAHFATHAVFRQTHPELSGLVLAPGPAPQYDAPAADYDLASGPAPSSLLSFYDVLQMKAPLQLVVLNACNSGLGKLLPGEGKLALDNAFLAAGASRVIATLWPVDDEASSVFMQHFYRALARTHSPLLSLQQAQSKMAQSDEWSAPYYWGAFTLTGNWQPFSN